MKRQSKKILYISLFIIFGILLQFLIHAGLEIWYINLLINDFEKYSFGYTWKEWFFIHQIFTTVLVVLGIIFGYWAGNLGFKKVYGRKNKN